jgi:hypothetical protein
VNRGGRFLVVGRRRLSVRFAKRLQFRDGRAPEYSLLPFSCERGPLVPLREVREPNPRTGERKMKSEQIKEITDRAAEQLVAAL